MNMKSIPCRGAACLRPNIGKSETGRTAVRPYKEPFWKIRILVWCVIVFLTATPVQAAVIQATSCSQQDVQAAINLAQYGDTVLVPAGEAIWTAIVDCQTPVGNVPCMLLSTKGIILKGGIGGVTAITLSGPAPRGAIKFSPDAASLQRNDPIEFTGFTIDANKQNYPSGSLCIYPYPSMAGIMDKVKIHNNVFKNSNGTTIGVYGPIYGVAYENNFISCGGYMNRWMGGDSNSWSRVPREYGTNTQFFFEDNTIRFEPGTPGGKDAFMTGQGAPGLVMRYNTFDLANSTGGELGDIHGLQSMRGALPGDNPDCGYDAEPCDPTRRICQQWSTIKVELYGNIWNNLPNNLYLWIVHRGSWLLMFNNILNGSGTGANPQYSQYSCDSCISQDGFPSMHVQNTYIWNNVSNGMRRDMTKRLDFCNTAIGSPYTITENIDFWNYNPNPLNGSTQQGINCGSAPPSGPCSIGDGYWQTSHSPCTTPPVSMEEMKVYTQSSRFYKCTAPNTWELYYIPYTYPHPLRNSDNSLTLTSPNGSEVWHKGEQRQIRWTSSGVTDCLTIELLQDSTVLGSIATDVLVSAGLYSWTVGRLQNGSFVTGQNLKIRIRTADGAVSASMDI